MANGGTTEEPKQNITLNILLLLHKRKNTSKQKERQGVISGQIMAKVVLKSERQRSYMMSDMLKRVCINLNGTLIFFGVLGNGM